MEISKMLASKLIAVIKEKKKPEIPKMKFSRFGSGWFGSAPMWGTIQPLVSRKFPLQKRKDKRSLFSRPVSNL